MVAVVVLARTTAIASAIPKPEMPTTESLRLYGVQRDKLRGFTLAEVDEIYRRWRVIEQERLNALSPAQRKAEEQQKRDTGVSNRKQKNQHSIDLLQAQIADKNLTEDQVLMKKRTLVDFVSEKLQDTLPGSDEERETQQKLEPLMKDCLSKDEYDRQKQRLAQSREFRATTALYETLALELSDKHSTASAQCDRLCDAIITNTDRPKAKALVTVAFAQSLRGNNDKALSLIEKAMAEHGEEEAPGGIVMPLKLAGNFWVGAIARHDGKTKQAVNAYKAILGCVDRGQAGAADWVFATLYLAEINSTALKDDQKALELFDSIKNMPAPSDPRLAEPLKAYAEWARYFGDRIRDKNGKAAAIHPDQSRNALLTAVTHAQVAGLANDPSRGAMSQGEGRALLDARLRRYIEDGVSTIDREIVQLCYGMEYSRFDFGEPSKERDAFAEKQLSDLFNSDSFWAPVAGMTLAYGQALRGKTAESDATYEQVKQRFPEYESAIAQAKQALAQQPPTKR